MKDIPLTPYRLKNVKFETRSIIVNGNSIQELLYLLNFYYPIFEVLGVPEMSSFFNKFVILFLVICCDGCYHYYTTTKRLHS